MTVGIGADCDDLLRDETVDMRGGSPTLGALRNHGFAP
jgi:hypothetical protein